MLRKGTEKFQIERIFAKWTNDNGLVSRINKELIKLNFKKYKRSECIHKVSYSKHIYIYTHTIKKHIEVFHISNNQGDGNTHEIPLHIRHQR